MPVSLKRLLFSFFVLSGFSGLVYQIVWVRMALASFGVITPFASVVVSVFMLGLALGTWLGGRHAAPLARRLGVSSVMLYGAAEGLIGLSAFAMPLLFDAGRALLLPVGSMASGTYLLLSALWISVSMLPWCLCMGVTFPLMMAFIRELRDADAEASSFSFLYLANVIGAMLGAICTSVVLIELLGFTHTLYVAAALNAAICIASVLLARRRGPAPMTLEPASHTGSGQRDERSAAPIAPLDVSEPLALCVLFMTGFASMGLEIIWMRAFTPVLGTLVYAFSGLLAVYLFATWLGSWLYRRRLARAQAGERGVLPVSTLCAVVAATVMLPALITVSGNLRFVTRLLAPTLGEWLGIRPATVMIAATLTSILPFCAALGYLTPMLVDRVGRGQPERAGRAYAVNIAGSILGPLAAAYLLLPWLGARLSMVLLAVPFALLMLHLGIDRPGSVRRRAVLAATSLLVVAALVQVGVYGRSFEEGSHIPRPVVRRDHTATVISYGQGFGRHLLVNGYGMTVLTPLTKVMAHLPLASLDHPPESAVVIAFGMGTTFRSLLSWNIDATAVELVPSVVDAFDYYHADAASVRADPKAHIVVDDGRRFLARTTERFDVITIDPPPPVEAAGSSLLYAEEFYAIAKQRLAPGGIVQAWFPDGILVEPSIRHAVIQAILNAFPHVRVFQSLQGQGLHILCSMEPIDVPGVDEFVRRMPERARRDAMEWPKPGQTLESFIQIQILDKEIPLESLVGPGDVRPITDDRPFNEYFVLRRHLLPSSP